MKNFQKICFAPPPVIKYGRKLKQILNNLQGEKHG